LNERKVMMSQKKLSMVADTGPLLALGVVGRLDLLSRLYSAVFVSASVRRELEDGAPKYTDARRVMEAIDRGWLKVIFITPALSEKVDAIIHGPPRLGRAQAESIVLCQQLRVNLILMDDRQAARVAQAAGLNVIHGLDIFLHAARSSMLSKAQALSHLLELEQARQYSEEELRLARKRIEQGCMTHGRG